MGRVDGSGVDRHLQAVVHVEASDGDTGRALFYDAGICPLLDQRGLFDDIDSGLDRRALSGYARRERAAGRGGHDGVDCVGFAKIRRL